MYDTLFRRIPELRLAKAVEDLPFKNDAAIFGRHELPVTCRRYHHMKIIADTAKCVGAGQCVLTEPDVFDQSEDDGTVIVLNAEPEGELIEKAREAVHICPSQALSLAE